MFVLLSSLAALSLLIWIYLLIFRGGFGGGAHRPDSAIREPSVWPRVAIVVPARNEAAVIGESLPSLLGQDYPGPFSVILVDDHSGDGTAEAALRAAGGESGGENERLSLLQAPDLPASWTGKLWALEQGLRAAPQDCRYLWFSDADIAQGPGALRWLVAKAETEARDLVSLMVALRCEGFWERLLIPPFIYFFQKLYPFAWVNDPKRRDAAAAGGCILVRRDALRAAGGLNAIRGALIDDCSLAARIKAGRRPAGNGIWLGLAAEARSIRPYQGLAAIWTMVARTAYTQLRYNPLLLAPTILGMAITYLAPPLLLLSAPWHHSAPAAAMAGLAWLLMGLSLLPTLRLYRQPLWLAPLLPLAAAFYSAMTCDSAWRHWRGVGGRWKGRTHTAPAAQDRSPVASSGR